MNPIGAVAALGGLFSIACAALDLNWFMDNQRAYLIVKILGRPGARIFYILFGIALTVFGVLLMLGILHDRSSS